MSSGGKWMVNYALMQYLNPDLANHPMEAVEVKQITKTYSGIHKLLRINISSDTEGQGLKIKVDGPGHILLRNDMCVMNVEQFKQFPLLWRSKFTFFAMIDARNTPGVIASLDWSITQPAVMTQIKSYLAHMGVEFEWDSNSSGIKVLYRRMTSSRFGYRFGTQSCVHPPFVIQTGESWDDMDKILEGFRNRLTCVHPCRHLGGVYNINYDCSVTYTIAESIEPGPDSPILDLSLIDEEAAI